MTVQDDLREVSFGVHEGTAMGSAWFAEWVAGTATPQGAESFAALRARAAAAITQALTHTAPVLVVAHGALFRALRAEMGLVANVRTPNAVPIFCEPGFALGAGTYSLTLRWGVAPDKASKGKGSALDPPKAVGLWKP